MIFVDDEEVKRLRQLERVVLNQLGTTDPKRVAEWIVAARTTMRADGHAAKVGLCAALEGDPSYVARCAPQADGASEQDVIALQRAYTAMRAGDVPPGLNPASVDGC